uniref:Si:dkeyp-97e7.9 n=1 Tax=Salmo trutta TaxID=8032 RepID=A0A673Z5K1_SALTR
MESSINIKAMTRLHKAEIMIAVEQLSLHNGKLIKDRQYYLRTYHKEALDRATVVCLMQHLMDHDIVHHVCDKYPMFKDAKLLYRFRKDDGIFPFNTVKVFIQGQRLYKHVITGRDSILHLREAQGVAYQRSFPGCQLIDWLLQNGKTESRRQGLELCRALLEHGIIHPVVRCYLLTFSPLHLAPKLRIMFCRGVKYLFPSLKCKSFYNIFDMCFSGFFCCYSWANVQNHPLITVFCMSGDGDVGWGFVVRGMAPVYVQAVDPGSPAAAAGVKVTQT